MRRETKGFECLEVEEFERREAEEFVCREKKFERLEVKAVAF